MSKAESPVAQAAGDGPARKQDIWRTGAAHLRRAYIWHRLLRQARRQGYTSRDLARFYRYLSTNLRLEEPQHTNPLQLPRNHFAGLKSQAVHDASEFPAIARLIGDFGAIKEELSRYTADISLAAHPQDLADRGRWNVLYFYAGGRPAVEVQRRCPKTAEAIAAFPGAGEAGQAYLSVLEPGTHIEAHCGPTNVRLRAHLGLAIPDDTRIRLGSEICRWHEGRCLVFDDSFEHEVWNDSTRERTVLIIDFWHPELTSAERWAITAARRLRWGLRDILHA